VELSQAISINVNEAFCDGINTGFYVNNYTTKPGPGLKTLMDELQTGIQRLENENKEREEKRKAEREAAEAAGEHLPGRRNKIFADTLRTLMRLTASYRRCHWKSAAEIIFPLLYQHLTFASHRTWKLYVKKAVFSQLKLGVVSMAIQSCSTLRIQRRKLSLSYSGGLEWMIWS